MGQERSGIRAILSKGAEIAGRLVKEEDGMLILTRKIDQGIIISGNIIVRVLSVERDRVKIGISAPGEVTVLRQELWVEGQRNQPLEKKPQAGTEPSTNEPTPTKGPDSSA